MSTSDWVNVELTITWPRFVCTTKFGDDTFAYTLAAPLRGSIAHTRFALNPQARIVPSRSTLTPASRSPVLASSEVVPSLATRRMSPSAVPANSVPSLPKASPSGPLMPPANGAAGPTVGGWASARVAPSHIAPARMHECSRIRGRVPHERSPRHEVPATFPVSRGPPRPHRLPPLLGGPVRRVRGGRVDALVLGVRRAGEPDRPRHGPGPAVRRESAGGGRLRARG